jgi:hypothetical protein
VEKREVGKTEEVAWMKKKRGTEQLKGVVRRNLQGLDLPTRE